ncbi:diaminopimelate epimerase [Pontiella agarivorans]|uniref:Diaminopimelate epimerase n=1 Tax=Pontiella agarivorans TaxID=3038953 RepID=A0ABU5MSI8_9BACT|nr:diaminopimelate epimerase [Pontiella agarivorans]MDZ8117159.1 diaminopimelate epimerase [Pontiella agarivorans]
MNISFHKMHGAGNDFIVIDDSGLRFPLDDTPFIQKMTARRTGVGCDGVLLIQPSETADFRMRFINPDGGEVDMCGNGARCIARRAFDLGLVTEDMTIETGAGRVEAQVLGRQVRICLTEPKDLKLGLDAGLERPLDFLNTGVEHAVDWVDDPSEIDVQVLGKKIREHPLFGSGGTNANFAKVEADGSIILRTYERGVEAETLACGTGAAAVGLIAAEKGWVSLPVPVHCAGGYDLVIDLFRNKATLTGGAEYVFEGTVEYGDRV